MFRRIASAGLSSIVAVRSITVIPEGFSFMESKVVDKPLNDNYENSDVLRLTLTRHDEVILKEEDVKCVSVSTINGDMGVFAGHAYKIAKLKPSPIIVEYADGVSQKYFTSGGFVHVNNEGSCDINCAEVIPIEDIDVSRAEKELAAAQAAVVSAKGDRAKAVEEIKVEVLDALVQCIKGSN
eukprot:Tbor_TRINITY_DN6046_c2_g1::TRINITY_DN6046_c2_g1_i1::g.10334::m.10334/K02134/ATPeF1D, ATP5D, ATP16; F-type H+-transporting ATPase subunit delta